MGRRNFLNLEIIEEITGTISQGIYMKISVKGETIAIKIKRHWTGDMTKSCCVKHIYVDKNTETPGVISKGQIKTRKDLIPKLIHQVLLRML